MFIWDRTLRGGREFSYTQQSVASTVNSADTLIIWTAAKSQARINYRHLTGINSRYYRLALIRTLTRCPVQCLL